MIIVIDSGIWISALRFGGTPAVALASIIKNHTVAMCTDIESEVLQTLERKFFSDPEATSERLHPFFHEALWVDVTGELTGVCRDPKDDCILECAVKAGAELIVTGDKDLLSLGEFRGIRILTARQYLDLRA